MASYEHEVSTRFHCIRRRCFYCVLGDPVGINWGTADTATSYYPITGTDKRFTSDTQIDLYAEDV